MDHPLRAYRARKGLTCEDIAHVARTSRVTVWRVENGYPKVSLKLLRRLSAATNGEVPLSAFIKAFSQIGPREPHSRALKGTDTPPSVPASSEEVV